MFCGGGGGGGGGSEGQNPLSAGLPLPTKKGLRLPGVCSLIRTNTVSRCRTKPVEKDGGGGGFENDIQHT